MRSKTSDIARLVFAAALTCLSSLGSLALAAEPPPPPPPEPVPVLKDALKDIYADYRPDFIDYVRGNRRDWRGWDIPEKVMRLSAEPEFYTLSTLEEDSRANALVEAALQKEAQGQHREALKIYQLVIEKYPQCLYRVSKFGVFMPVAKYCQRRLLGFPPRDLAFYRTVFDARASEAYEQARRKNSLLGLSDVANSLLATSYGGRALLTLGMSALDRGHYMEALEYFDQVWEGFPDPGLRGAELAMPMALCRKVLGQASTSGERHGLIGHWKLDEGSGNKAADSSGNRNNGTIAVQPNWTQGKVGGALHFDRLPNYASNCVNVPAATPMNIGVGGADFSVAFWVKWEAGSYPNALFVKRGRTASEMLALEVTRGERLQYSIATDSPTWETGTTKRPVALKNWTHVGFVKKGNEIKVFLDGKLDLRETLKGPALQNLGGVTFGQQMEGCMDDVRLYNRALLDREVAEFAGTVGAAKMTVSTTSGEAPLTVEFEHAAEGAGAVQCLWEFGDGDVAAGPKAQHTYKLGGNHIAILTVTDANGAVSVARSTIAAKWQPESEGFAKTMSGVLDAAQSEKTPWTPQLASAPHVAADDYTLFPPTNDPMALTPPTWEQPLPGSRNDYFVFTQPVVTNNSVIYRHKNIVYCHALLTGELRWTNDVGGRAVWQNFAEGQLPQEDVLVQDGLVFAVVSKGGPSLVALDEVTGQIRWAYGPTVASTDEETKMRFEAAPTGGPRTVYAGYVLDNIEGDTHIDSEYGVMAFDSTTGRMRWRTPLCRLAPGKFAAGFAEQRRNRIRSFTTPPLYHEGTVYYTTNAGAIAALDALSGAIKWLSRYPYYPAVHDSTRVFDGTWPLVPGRRGLRFWYNQRPLLVGEQLYVLPVDTPFLFSMDRRTGRVKWTKPKEVGDIAYFLGPISTGELLMVYSGRGRGRQINWYGGDSANPVQLLNPDTGQTLWSSGDLMLEDDSPVMKHYIFGTCVWFDMNRRWTETAARPFLTADDRLYVATIADASVYWRPGCHAINLTSLDLRKRAILEKRRYYTSELIAHADWIIHDAGPQELKALEDLPHRDEQAQHHLDVLKEIVVDHAPINPQGPFMPFSRITFERYGVPFELRLNARSIQMIYDRPAVRKIVESQQAGLAGDARAVVDFARAELATAESRFDDAATLFNQCLLAASSENLDFRALVNQQLFQVHKSLCRSRIRSGDAAGELDHALGMARTGSTLPDEMETLFALAETYERKGEFNAAARCLRSIIDTYGHHEYPVAPTSVLSPADIAAAAGGVLDGAGRFGENAVYGESFSRALALLKKGLPLYLSTVSPLPRTLTVRAGELAAARLIRLQQVSPEFAAGFEKTAAKELAACPPDEQFYRLREFPGTPTAQKALEALFASSAPAKDEAARLRLWYLADTARVSGLRVPDAFLPAVSAPAAAAPAEPAIKPPAEERELDLADPEGINWLVLERDGERDRNPDLIFLAGRVRKRLDNKFILSCVDPAAGKTLWDNRSIRLKGTGQEPGFFKAYTCGDLVVVHGLYDVLAFELATGKPRWQYRVPFDFEIKASVLSGAMLVLSGSAETVTLHLPTASPTGEVAWQMREMGDLYTPPYFVGDRFVSIRKMPFSVTVRYRATGRLMGRFTLPDLSLFTQHPLLEDGPQGIPIARDGKFLAVTDGWYYILVDVEKPAVVWKRLIDNNDLTREPPLRFTLLGEYLLVLKEDYDQKVINMLSSRTGELLWRTDPKDARSPQPMYSVFIDGDNLYGIGVHPGQGFYFVGRSAKTGALLFSETVTGYGGKPQVTLLPHRFGNHAVVQVQDQQDFELRVFDIQTGKPVYTVHKKGVGPFGEHGRVSATVQNGRIPFLAKDKLSY